MLLLIDADISIVIMKYLSIDTIDTTSHPYPDTLKSISISIRGTKSFFNIYFSADDVEKGFGITLNSQTEFTWINTDHGRKRYLRYPVIKHLLYQLKDEHSLAEPYLSWVDGLLFSNPSSNLFFRSSLGSTNATIEIDDRSDYGEIESIYSFMSDKEDGCFVKALQHKVDQLEYQVELQKKDIQILQRDVQIRDKEIELLEYRLENVPKPSTWV